MIGLRRGAGVALGLLAGLSGCVAMPQRPSVKPVAAQTRPTHQPATRPIEEGGEVTASPAPGTDPFPPPLARRQGLLSRYFPGLKRFNAVPPQAATPITAAPSAAPAEPAGSNPGSSPVRSVGLAHHAHPSPSDQTWLDRRHPHAKFRPSDSLIRIPMLPAALTVQVHPDDHEEKPAAVAGRSASRLDGPVGLNSQIAPNEALPTPRPPSINPGADLLVKEVGNSWDTETRRVEALASEIMIEKNPPSNPSAPTVPNPVADPPMAPETATAAAPADPAPSTGMVPPSEPVLSQPTSTITEPESPPGTSDLPGSPSTPEREPSVRQPETRRPAGTVSAGETQPAVDPGTRTIEGPSPEPEPKSSDDNADPEVSKGSESVPPLESFLEPAAPPAIETMPERPTQSAATTEELSETSSPEELPFVEPVNDPEVAGSSPGKAKEPAKTRLPALTPVLRRGPVPDDLPPVEFPRSYYPGSVKIEKNEPALDSVPSTISGRLMWRLRQLTRG